MNNEGLLKAILAASSRHLAIKASMEGRPKDTTDSIGYYAQALRFLQMGMKYQSYTRSAELLATVLIIALFEMLDGSPLGWERHLKGIFWIQRSQDSNGECGGLKQAIWWNWLNQDIWSAMRERRRVFSFYKPVRSYENMEPYEVARRSTYLLAQAVNFSSKEEARQREYDPIQGQERAACLLRMLDDWRAALTVEFRPLPFEHNGESAFAPIWINPPAFGAALQQYNLARILIMVHSPSFTETHREYYLTQIEEAVNTIVGIALLAEEGYHRIISIGCLFSIALMDYLTDDFSKRQLILDLIHKHQRMTGWPA
ncbi:hypothetical protein LTS18_014698, partial [Coniosporium uncinatum]